MTNSVLEEFHLKDDIKGGFVSTVYIPRLELYETMVKIGQRYVYQERCNGEQEAREGHKRVLDEAKANPRKYMEMSL